MNEDDIQLIISLIGGELSEAEESAAFSTIASDPELQGVYDEQLAVSSTLGAASAVAMTTDETVALHAALRTELQLDDAAIAPAAAASGWSRWWAPLSGLAIAAVVVFAIAVVPGMLDGTDSAEFVSAPEAATTTAPLELTTSDDGQLRLQGGVDSAGEEAPSTTVPAFAATEGAAEEPMSAYFLAPEAARKSDIDLPVLDDDAVASSELNSVLAEATEFNSVDVSALSTCFVAGAAGSALTLVGVTPDGSSVYATATDLESGEETLVLIDLANCALTKAG